jgi:hypothetical protein
LRDRDADPGIPHPEPDWDRARGGYIHVEAEHDLGSVNLMALPSKLTRIWRIRSGCHYRVNSRRKLPQ